MHMQEILKPPASCDRSISRDEHITIWNSSNVLVKLIPSVHSSVHGCFSLYPWLPFDRALFYCYVQEQNDKSATLKESKNNIMLIENSFYGIIKNDSKFYALMLNH